MIAKAYFQNGKIEYVYVSNSFYSEFDSLHREDGLALITDYSSHFNWFCLFGIRYNPSFFAQNTNHLICKLCQKFCKQSCFRG